MDVAELRLIYDLDDSTARQKLDAWDRHVRQVLNNALPTQQIRLNTSQASQQVTHLDTQLSRLQQRIQNLQRSGYYSVAAGGTATATVTAPLLAAGAGIVKFAGDYEESMQHVITLTDVSRKELDGLKKQVLALATDSRIRQGPTELADALYYVTSTGLKGADGMKVLKAAALGASAGLGETKVVANTLTTVLDAYGLTADKAAKAADTLTEAVRFGKGEADQYAAAFPKVIAIAAQAGVTFEEVAAQMASATRIGLTPSESATALRQIFNNIIDPSEKAKRAMQELGTSVQELRIMLREKGLFNTLKDLQERTGGRIGPITELFGSIRALTGFLSTTGENTLQEYRKTLLAINDAHGSTATAASTASETFRFQLDKLKSTAEGAAISLGTKYLPAITDVVEVTGEKIPAAIDASVNAWNALPAPLQTTLKYLVGIVALAGPVKLVSGNVMILVSALLSLSKIAGLSTVLSALQSMGVAWGLGGAGAGISAFVTGLTPAVASVGALALAVEVGATAWQVYSTRIDEAAIATHNLKMNSENLNRSLDFAATIADGSNNATLAVEKLRAKISEIGDDPLKIGSALKELTDTKHEIKSLGLSPAAEQAFRNQINNLIRDVEARKISLDVEPGETLSQIIGRGLFGSNLQGLPSVISSGFNPLAILGSQAGSRLGESYANARQHARDLAKPFEPKVFTAPGVAADQKNAQKTIDISKATYGQLQQILDEYNKKAASGQQLTNNELMRFQQAKSRRDQIVEEAQKGKAEADRIRREREADAAERQRQIEEENAERLRRIEMQSLQARMQMWQTFGNAVEGVLGRITQVAEEGSVVGEKTAKARMEAEMLKRQYEGIPEPLRRAVVELATIEYKMKRIVETRDAWRGLFGDIARTLRQAGISTGALEDFAGKVQGRLGQGAEMQRLQAVAGTRGAMLVNAAEAQRAAAQSRIEVLQEAGRRSGQTYEADVYGGAGATSSTGMAIAQHAVDLQVKGVARKFVHACDRLADKTVNDVTRAYSSIMGPKGADDTAAKTMRRFQRAGIGMPYQSGMALAPGGLMYTGRTANGAGHVAIVGPDGQLLDQYGSNKFKRSSFEWYVPPPGASAGGVGSGGSAATYRSELVRRGGSRVYINPQLMRLVMSPSSIDGRTATPTIAAVQSRVDREFGGSWSKYWAKVKSEYGKPARGSLAEWTARQASAELDRRAASLANYGSDVGRSWGDEYKHQRQRIKSEYADKHGRIMVYNVSFTPSKYRKVKVPARASEEGTAQESTAVERRVAATPPVEPAVPPRKIGPIGFAQFDPKLLNSPGLGAGWGGEVTNSRLAPGESREIQHMMQEFLRAQMEKGQTFSPGFLRSARNFAIDRDMDLSIKAQTDKAADSIQEMGRRIRLVGKENNPYAVLKEEMEHGALALLQLTPQGRAAMKSLKEMTLGEMVGSTRQATRQMRQQFRDQAAAMAEAHRVSGAFSGAAYDRALFSGQKRREIWRQEDIVRLWQAGKATEANRQAQIRLNEALADYDLNRQTEQLKDAETATLSFTRATASLVAQRRYLNANAGAPETQITEGLQQIIDYQSKYAEVVDRVGEAEAKRMANDYAFRQGVLRQMERQIDAQREYDKAIRESADSVALQGQLQGIMRGTAAYSPERARQIAEATERSRLMAAAAGDLTKTGQIPGQIEAFMADYDAKAKTQAVEEYTQRLSDLDREMATLGDTTGLAALRFDLLQGKLSLAGDNGELLQKTIRNLRAQMELDSMRGLLSEQSQFRSQFTTSARGRLEEELRVRDEQAALVAPLPPALLMQQQTDDARRRGMANLQDEYARVTRQLDAQKQLELSAAETAARRVEIEQRYAAILRERFGIVQNQFDAEREADERTAARTEDMVNRVRSGADAMRDSIRTGLEDGFSAGLKSIADRLKDRALDTLATYLTNRLSDGFVGIFGDSPDGMRSRIPTTGGFAGPVGSVAPFVPLVRDMAGLGSSGGASGHYAAQAAAAMAGGAGQGMVFDGAVFNNPRIIGGALPGTGATGSSRPTDTQFLGAVGGLFLGRRGR